MESLVTGYFDNIRQDFLFRHLITNYMMQGAYHCHDGYEFYLFLKGNVNCYVEQQCFHLERGDLLIIRPGEYHRPIMLDDGDYERITLNLHETLLQRLSSEKSNLSAVFRNHPQNKACFVQLHEEQLEQLLSLTSQIETLLHSDAFGADILIQSHLLQILVLVNTAFQTAENTTPNIMPKLIRDLLRYIDTNLSEKITLESLEQKFFLNGTYLSRQFKKHTGLTLRNYLLERRISHAKTLLATDLSITEVCQQSGFSDYANFIRSFTKATGMSPGKYAKLWKAAEAAQSGSSVGK
ncbi:MAG: AraC family transcriptional regulator [Lachnospiraceae bacterium]|nr:AraC family transcriptional regulator [Lachnospiraceae bacterium]